MGAFWYLTSTDSIIYWVCLQHFSCGLTTVGTLHARSLQGFGYSDVVHQFEKRCKSQQDLQTIVRKIYLSLDLRADPEHDHSWSKSLMTER